jgi:hypothetical protein
LVWHLAAAEMSLASRKATSIAQPARGSGGESPPPVHAPLALARDELALDHDLDIGRLDAAVGELYSLVHREDGPLRTFATAKWTRRSWNEEELERVFGDEPAWVGTMRVESFELVVRDDEGYALVAQWMRTSLARSSPRRSRSSARARAADAPRGPLSAARSASTA